MPSLTFIAETAAELGAELIRKYEGSTGYEAAVEGASDLRAIADAIMRLPVSQHESQEAEAVAQRV